MRTLAAVGMGAVAIVGMDRWATDKVEHLMSELEIRILKCGVPQIQSD